MRAVLALVLIVGLGTAALASDPPQPATDAASSVDDLIPPGCADVFKKQDGGEIMAGCISDMDGEALVLFYRPVLEKMGWRFTGDFRDATWRNYGLAKGEKGEGMLMLQRAHGHITILLDLKE